jgi:hypothetical protein
MGDPTGRKGLFVQGFLLKPDAAGDGWESPSGSSDNGLEAVRSRPSRAHLTEPSAGVAGFGFGQRALRFEQPFATHLHRLFSAQVQGAVVL